MRVSKAVKEYIEKQVNAKFPKSPAELKNEEIDKVAVEMYNAYVEEMKKHSKDVINTLVKQYNIKEDDISIDENGHYYRSNPFQTYNTPTHRAYVSARQKRNKMIEEKIQDIIVTLELGGTKADLEKMLAEIK